MIKEDLRSIRTKAKQILDSLEVNKSSTYEYTKEEGQQRQSYNSWIRGEVTITTTAAITSNSPTATDEYVEKEEYPSNRCKYFDKNGFLLLRAFSNEDEIKSMKDQMQSLVDEQWHPNDDDNNDDNNDNENNNNNDSNSNSSDYGQNRNGTKITVFRTDDKQIDTQGSDDYFLESANKVHFFAESKAIQTSSTKLKPEFLQNKMKALNKAGHGLHMMPGPFQAYTKSTKLQSIVHELGWEDPVVPQSMYIFKQAHVGGEVTSHQDSTFLYTTPKQSCLGLWLALDDATVENGCLWVRPYSHFEKVRRVFGRNPEHFSEEVIKKRGNVAHGDLSKSQMIFTAAQLPKDHDCDGTTTRSTATIPWEGSIPQSMNKNGDNDDNDDDDNETKNTSSQWDALFSVGFVPIECKAGDLIIFPGELDHLSLANHSEHQRHTFQLHLVEGEGAGVHWAESNWLQYPKGIPFMRLNEDYDNDGKNRNEQST